MRKCLPSPKRCRSRSPSVEGNFFARLGVFASLREVLAFDGPVEPFLMVGLPRLRGGLFFGSFCAFLWPMFSAACYPDQSGFCILIIWIRWLDDLLIDFRPGSHFHPIALCFRKNLQECLAH